MKNKYSFRVGEADRGKRLDRYLLESLAQISSDFSFSRNFIQKLIKGGRVKINGKVNQKAGYLLEGGEKIELSIPQVSFEVKAEKIPLRIIFEDDDILVIDKKPQMVILPDSHHQKGSLLAALMFYLKKEAKEIEENLIVHRLDKDTSGVMVIAKNQEAGLFLKEQFKKRKVKKKYIACLFGRITPEEGIIKAAVGRDKKSPFKMKVVPDSEGKMAISYYKVLKYLDGFSLVEVWPKTGRTHQIRVHFSSLGYPIIGDPLYGDKNSQKIFKRPFLHASFLEFAHPRTKEKISFESPLPKDLLDFLKEKGIEKNKIL